MTTEPGFKSLARHAIARAHDYRQQGNRRMAIEMLKLAAHYRQAERDWGERYERRGWSVSEVLAGKRLPRMAAASERRAA